MLKWVIWGTFRESTTIQVQRKPTESSTKEPLGLVTARSYYHHQVLKWKELKEDSHRERVSWEEAAFERGNQLSLRNPERKQLGRTNALILLPVHSSDLPYAGLNWKLKDKELIAWSVQ